MAGTLGPADTARLTDFARTLKAAARAVVLYPDGHPAVRSSLGRLVDLTSTDRLRAPLRIGVTRDTLLMDGNQVQRPDAAVIELASMLHLQLVGELTIRPGVDAAAWQHFLRLLGRSADEIRTRAASGGLWTGLATHAIAVREIDYAELLRERSGGAEATWEQIVAGYLTGDAVAISPQLLELILEGRLEGSALTQALDDFERTVQSEAGDIRGQAGSLMRLLRGIVQAAHARMPEQVAPVMETLSAAFGRLSADAVLALLREAARPGSDAAPITPLLRQMPDDAVATFLARNIAGAADSALERVAQAFQALVVDEERRERLVGLVGGEAAELLSIGGNRNWPAIAETLLTRYSDQEYVPQDYASELSHIRGEAVRLEQALDDPPERQASWRATVSTHELRRLDQQLITDLLSLVEGDQDRRTLMPAVQSLADDLWQVGDYGGAERLLIQLARDRWSGAPERAAAARGVLESLTAPSSLDHLVGHLATVDDSHFEEARRCAVLVGEPLISPMVEALSRQERSRVRERLTSILIAFGPPARQQLEQLKTSTDPVVRRTATYLLREFGGSDVLPEVSELTNDREPALQREAVRAIVRIGSEPGYALLKQALTRGTPRARDGIMQAIGSVRDQNTPSLLVYLVEHINPRRSLARIYARALELLGQLNDPVAVPALRAALDRSQWWAPRRTSALRRAAAAALARIDAPAARDALQEAADTGDRGVRAAALAELNRLPSLQPTSEAR